MDNKEIVNALNKLIEINNDRFEGYEKAMTEVNDSDLKATFSKFAMQSRKFNVELGREVTKKKGKPAESTTTSGKFYRAWMDIKSSVSGNDRKAVLELCEFGEDAAKEAYKDCLDKNIPADVRTLVTSQYTEILASHNEVKAMRDAVSVDH